MQFRLRVGASPLKLQALDVFARSVSVSQKPGVAFKGCKNNMSSTWSAAGAVRSLETDPPMANVGVWNLTAAAGSLLEVGIAINGNLPAGHFTYVVRLTETNGTEHWVESAAIQLVQCTVALPSSRGGRPRR